MIVRKATQADIPKLMPFARAFHDKGVFNDKSFNEHGAMSYLNSLMNNAHTRVFVHEKGVIGVALEQGEMNSGTVLRERFFMAHDRTGAPLLNAFEAWGKELRVDKLALSMIVDDGEIPEKLHDYYVGLGYTLVEAVYVKDVS